MDDGITPPIFVFYLDGRTVAFSEVFEAETISLEELTDVREVWDARARRISLVPKHAYSLRASLADDTPDEAAFRVALAAALEAEGDIGVVDLPLGELHPEVLRSSACLSARTSTGGQGCWMAVRMVA